MKLKLAPFYIVLLASVLPWAAAAANAKWITYIPDVAAAAAYMLFVAKFPGPGFRIHPYFAAVLLLVLLHILFGLLTGRGIGSGGMASLFVLTFIFSKLLAYGNTEYSVREITYWINQIYILHLVFILSELLFRLAGHTDILVAIAGHATEVMGYKTYNSAPFLAYLGFEDISGMNSLLLGSQSASQLVMIAAFWFAPFYKGFLLLKKGWPRWFWFIFCVALFPFVASMTAMVLLAVWLLVMFYILPNSTLNKRLNQLTVPLFVAIFGSFLISLFAFRIDNKEHVKIYMDAFMDTPIKFLDLPLLDKIMGFGSNLRATDLSSTDFGLGALVFQSGLYMMGLALLCFMLMIVAVCRAIRRDSAGGRQLSAWAALAGINLVCAIGWAVSLIHYTPAVELGGRHIFAMHLAVCLVALQKLADIRRSKRHIDFQVKNLSVLPTS